MYNMHLIINTHWDREYRWSFSETQFRLAEAVDDLIDIMKNDKRFAYFHTDSQASMLDDYLEIRPERAEELKALVREGRILTGPWYTLPAEFLVSGESLVRNLLMGHRISKNLGNTMKTAYNIFSWGQVSQLPQIYRQFGMDCIIFYRGIDQAALDTLEFRWKAPDGTEALGITFGSFHRLNFWKYVYLPYILGNTTGNGNGHCITRENLGSEGFLINLCDEESDDINHLVVNQPCGKDMRGALEGMKELVDTVKDKSSVKDLLFLQGFDQENPDPIVTDLIDRINDSIDYGTLKVSSLPEYTEKVKNTLIKERILERLPVREGEMLEVEKVGDAFGPLYNGVFSSRMPVKLMNSQCQYLLETWAEPAAVWNMLLGKSYPEIPLRNAWKEVLKNQQHDGIGGCHVDRVSETMKERYSQAKDIAETVVKTSLKDLTCQIDLRHLNEQEIGLVVYNSAQFVRSEVMLVSVDIPKEWNFRYNGHYKRDFSLEVLDSKGNCVRSQVLLLDDDSTFGYLKYGNVIAFDVTRCKIAFYAENIPAMGYSTFTIRPLRSIQRPVELLSPEVNVLENGFLRAKIENNGTITLLSKESGTLLENLNYFEDSGDKGGPLIYDQLFEKGIFTTLSANPSISLVHNGPLYAKYRIEYEWQLPGSLSSEMKIHVPHGSEWVDYGRLQRSDKKKTLLITSEVSLRKDSRKLEFVTRVDNTICDHRLRVVFRTGFKEAEHCYADSPFDVVQRPIRVPDSTGWYEAAARTWPSQSFVAVKGAAAVVSVIHKGIPEYEVTDDNTRSICLTLIRANRTAGNPTETYRYQELAQCHGVHTFNYSIFVGSAQENDDACLLAESVLSNVPMRAAQTTRHSGKLEARKSFFEVSSSKFMITAVKKAENEDALLIRGFNLSDGELDISIRLGFKACDVKKVTLEENEIEKLPVTENGTFSTRVGKREIASFMIKV